MGLGGFDGRVGVGVLFAALVGCASTDPRPPSGDAARRVTPVPACVAPARGRAAGGARRALREPELWGLVFPAFDPVSFRLPADAQACNGQVTVRDAVGAAAGGAWVQVPQGSAVYGGGADRLKVVWLPFAQEPDGAGRGAIALVRSFDDTAELYAVGVHRGSRQNTTLALERLGTELLVVASDDGCKGAPDRECVTSARVYADRQGLLAEVAHFDLQRVALGSHEDA